jgi:hypothetical protein
MSSSAAQLPRHRGGTCRHAEPPSVAEHRRRCNPRGLRRRAGGRRRRRGCPDAGHAVRHAVRVRCPPCGPTSVQLVGRTPGVQVSGVQVSGVHATGVQTTGVIQVCGQPGVRCPRPLQPRCPHHAGSRASLRRDPATVVAGTSVDGSLAAAWQAHRLRCRAGRLADPGSWSSARCRSVGWGAGKGRCSHVAPGVCILGRSPA